MERMRTGTCQLILAMLLLCAHLGMSEAHADTVTYLHADGLGTPVMETNESGQVTYTRDVKPFGAQALGTPKYGPGFTGQVEDADTGLVYMKGRYYDPVSARFISNDPVATSVQSGASFNRYSYALNNPYAMSDPSGMKAWSGHLCDIGGCETGSFNKNEDEDEDQAPCPSYGACPKFEEPKDAIGGINNPEGNPWEDVLNKTCEGDTCTIGGTVTIDGYNAEKVAAILTAAYNGTYTEVGQKTTFVVNIKFTAVEKNGFMTVSPFVPASARRDATVYGAMRLNQKRMYLDRKLWDELPAGLVAHEFGHGLGLNHQGNSSTSIMNYAFCTGMNRVHYFDIMNIAGAYK